MTIQVRGEPQRIADLIHVLSSASETLATMGSRKLAKKKLEQVQVELGEMLIEAFYHQHETEMEKK
jgi:hypothetical protein